MIKRSLDIILSLIAIIILSPLLIPIIVMLKMTGEGYIFYKQKRVGRDKRLFDLLKFATMFKDSPNMEGGSITAKDDPRILPFGKFLRKNKINELPQILNILIGDMSIIGRRPTVSEHYNFYNADIKRIISKLKPGLSGVSSIIFRNEEKYFTGKTPDENKDIYRNKIAPFKGELEIWYCQNQTTLVDLLLIFITILYVVKPSSNVHNYFIKDLPKHPLYNPA
jgi:lipopolysaccharide/colanic/teichoic acid biosynthesis glycosyltransferase